MVNVVRLALVLVNAVSRSELRRAKDRRLFLKPQLPAQAKSCWPTLRVAVPSLELCGRGEGLQCLPHSQIRHDLLTATGDAGELVRALQDLHVLAHTARGECAAAEDLASLVRNEGQSAGGLVLQNRNRPSQLHHLYPWVHRCHLVRDGLHVALKRLNPADHSAELVPDDSLGHQLLAEDLPLHAPQQAIPEDQARGSKTADTEEPPLMVE